jgi:hypothetical protein
MDRVANPVAAPQARLVLGNSWRVRNNTVKKHMGQAEKEI